jgi:hypothetical protein
MFDSNAGDFEAPVRCSAIAEVSRTTAPVLSSAPGGMRSGMAWRMRAIVGSLLVAVPACAEPEGEPSGAITCDRQPPLDWDNFGAGFLELHCTSCHSSQNAEPHRSGAPVGVDFDTYGDVVRHVSRIESQATGADPEMPPAGGPTQAELALLREWLTCAVWPDHDALVANGQL